LEGRGRFRYGEDDWAVEPGSLIFVEARAPHKGRRSPKNKEYEKNV
jgi:mannose-6-phosphate isomerase-like protein (cupin superfamily)